MEKEQSCKALWARSKDARVRDLRRLWKAEQAGNEEGIEDLGTLNEYGLCFDHVAPGTFNDQPYGYWRYQNSCGGPCEEFRFYGTPRQALRVEFTYLAWYTGHTRALVGRDLVLLQELFAWFAEGGTTESTRAAAEAE